MTTEQAHAGVPCENAHEALAREGGPLFSFSQLTSTIPNQQPRERSVRNSGPSTAEQARAAFLARVAAVTGPAPFLEQVAAMTEPIDNTFLEQAFGAHEEVNR